MILETTADLKKYLSISGSFEFPDFEPYINKVAMTFTKRYIGNLHTELADEATGTNATIKNEARELLRNAIANFGYFLYMPFAAVQMDSAGITIVNNDQRKSAEWYQLKDIRRELIRCGHEAMDLLMEILEANPTVFTDYATNFSSINNELLVKNASEFSKYYNIFESRQTYLSLQPTIRLVQDQYIKTFICKELIEALKDDVSDNLLEVKEALQKAIVSFTVAKVSNNGLFLLDDRGLRVDFETFINGRRESTSYGKSVQQIETLATELIANGTQYLKQAKEVIENNLGDFNQCDAPLLNATTSGSGFKPYDSKGILAL